MIYPINPVIQTNIGSRGPGSIGEPIVPGDPHIPADLCSLPPSTRPHDPNTVPRLPPYALSTEQCGGRSSEGLGCFASHLTHATTAKKTADISAAQRARQASKITASATPTTRPTKQQTRPEQSFQILQSAPKLSKNSSNATTFKMLAADSADRQAARHSQNDCFTRASNEQTLEQKMPIKEGLQILQSAPKLSKNSSNATTFKTYATVVKASQAAESPTATPTRAARTNEVPDFRTIERSTISPTTVINDTKPCADLFTGKPKRVDKDGACLFSSLGGQHAKKLVREALVDWLKENPHCPFHTTTLAQHVMDETGEAWSVYCARMQSERTWGGLPELVAASQVWHCVVRVFENVGNGHFHLRAVLGEESFSAAPIDLVLESDHYDTLTEVHPVKMIQPEKIAEVRPLKTTPIETLTLELKALGRLKELESCLRPKTPMQFAEPKAERKTPEQSTETETRKATFADIEHKTPEQPEIEHKAPEQLAEPKTERERQVLDELAARKELKQLEEREARERHVMRKELAERKAIEKLAEPKTKPKIEPQDPASHEKPKYQHESRKARAAREQQDGLQAYRVHRARDAQVPRKPQDAQLDQNAGETPSVRDSQGARCPGGGRATQGPKRTHQGA